MDAPPATVAKPGVSRYFRGGSWCVNRDDRDNAIHVLVDGTQYVDGRVKRFIMVSDGGTEVLIELGVGQVPAARSASDRCG